MRTWKGCRVCPFLILENICYSERQFPLGVKQIRSVSPVVTRIYSPTWTRDSPFGLPIPVPGCSRRTWEGGVPAALCGSRIWEPHLGVSNPARKVPCCAQGRLHQVRPRRCSDLLTWSRWAGGADGNLTWFTGPRRPWRGRKGPDFRNWAQEAGRFSREVYYLL